MVKSLLVLLSVCMGLIGLSACTYDNWDNTPPKNEIPGGWDDIRFHNHDVGYDSSTAPPLAHRQEHAHHFG